MDGHIEATRICEKIVRVELAYPPGTNERDANHWSEIPTGSIISEFWNASSMSKSVGS